MNEPDPDYTDKGLEILFVLVLIAIGVGVLVFGLVKHQKLTFLIIGGFTAIILGLWLLEKLCYALGYLYYELPERINRWR